MLTDELRAGVSALKDRYPSPASALMPAFWAIQSAEGQVSADAASEVAEILGLPPAYANGVLTFYGLYRTRPAGRFVLQVCRTLSCQMAGARSILQHLRDRLGIQVGETTPDGLFTLLTAECLASCGTGPVMLVNEDLHERLTPESIDALLARLRLEAGATM